MIFLGSVLERQVAPVNVRIEAGIRAILEEIQFLVGIGGCKSVVETGTIESIGILVSVHHICKFRTELELMAIVCLDVCPAFNATLGLHQDGTIDAFVAEKSRRCSIFQDGDALYFLYTKAIDGTLVAVNQYEDAFVVKCMVASDIK